MEFTECQKMQNNANKKRPAESRSMILLTTVKQRFNIQLVRQVQIRLPLKNLMVKKTKQSKFQVSFCVMQMCTSVDSIQPT